MIKLQTPPDWALSLYIAKYKKMKAESYKSHKH